MKEQTKKRMAHIGRVRVGLISLAVLVVITGLVLWTRIKEGDQITIKITWQGRSAGLLFAVEMEPMPSISMAMTCGKWRYYNLSKDRSSNQFTGMPRRGVTIAVGCSPFRPPCLMVHPSSARIHAP